MRFSDKEKRIIAALQLRADTPLTQIAAETGLREHTVRYAVHSLVQRAVLQPHVVVNLTRLGYTEYEVLLTLACDSQATVGRFIRALVESERVSWLAPTAGDFQYVLILAARGVRDVADFFAELAERFGHIVCAKAIAARISLTLYRRRHLYAPKQRVEAVTIDHTSEQRFIDKLDHQILAHLARNPSISARLIAQQLHIPYSTLTFRLERLKEEGIIVAFTYLLNFSRYGMHMYRLLLNVRGLNPAIKHQLSEFCSTHPYITSLTQAVGDWDFVVAAEAEQPHEITVLSQTLYQLFGGQLQNVRVLSRFWNTKWLMYPFQQWQPHVRSEV